jgi:hypothetical protein
LFAKKLIYLKRKTVHRFEIVILLQRNGATETKTKPDLKNFLCNSCLGALVHFVRNVNDKEVVEKVL